MSQSKNNRKSGYGKDNVYLTKQGLSSYRFGKVCQKELLPEPIRTAGMLPHRLPQHCLHPCWSSLYIGANQHEPPSYQV